MFRRHAAIAAGAVLAVGAAAHADDANLSSFKPTSGSDGLLSTEGARPLGPKDSPFELKLVFDASWNPVTIRSGGSITNTVLAQRNTGWLSAQAHVFGPLALAVQVPVAWVKIGDLRPPASFGFSGTDPSQSALGDVRITPRLSVTRQEDQGLNVALQGTVELPIGSGGGLMSDDMVSGQGLIAVSRRFETDGPGLELLANVFASVRPVHRVLGVTVGNTYGGRLGAALYTRAPEYPWLPMRLFGEFEAMAWGNSSDSRNTPTEWRAGLTWCLFDTVGLDIGGGTGLSSGFGSPTGRLVGALGYQPTTCGADARAARAAAEKAAAEKAAAEQAAAEKAAAEKAAAEKAAAEKAAAEKAAAERAAAEAAQKAAAEKAAAEAAEKAAKEAAEKAAREKDTDGDGVPDIEDNCPTEPGPKENHGCPLEKKQMVALQQGRIQILEKVEFSVGKATIAKKSNKLLDQVAAVMKAHPEIKKIEVQGHTDSSGNAEKNKKLSQARADAVRTYLVKKGVATDRLEAKGYGSEKPLESNDTKAGREKNRRVEFHVIE